MHIFFSDHITGSHFYLNEEESRHAVKVLRMKEKDPVIVVDGKGTFVEGEITRTDSKLCEVQALKVISEYGKRNFSIHIAIAPTKNIDRIEWFIEKSVEIGIDKISFIQCNRSERKHINPERMQKIAVSAMKQSLKAYLPEVNDLVPYKKFISDAKEEKRFIAHLEEGMKKEFKNEVSGNGNYCILIGPEGDFTPDEINMAFENKFIPVSLGESRLRTETAGIVACHTINLLNSGSEK